MKRAMSALAAAAAVLVTSGGAATAARPAPTEPSLVGSAKLLRAGGHDVRFAFDAHGLGPDARGTFRVTHSSPTADVRFSGTIDCLIVGGPVAVATGVITESSLHEFIGLRRGFTVYDHGRHDRLGYSWLLDPGNTESVPLCVSTAPFETLEKGDFRAVEWLPPQTRP